jgi:nucleotide-binding universal stress UspA family protein
MKVLIAYDGSDCANVAIEDLSRAGLPAGTEALILTVTENWLPEDLEERRFVETFGFAGAETYKQIREVAMEKLAEGEKLSETAAEIVRQKFPGWQVNHKTEGGSPGRVIIAEAEALKPDLIVVGSHGRSGVGRFLLGSVSLKILSEAQCPVRIARRSAARTENDDSPLRIVIGIDGSDDSRKAFEFLAQRDWKPETSVRLVTAIEALPYSILLDEMPQAQQLRNEAAEVLRKKGLHVSCIERFGAANAILVEEAEKWGADAIFIGAKGHRLVERVLFGSVSYAVAARAHCSVEVVRSPLNTRNGSKR